MDNFVVISGCSGGGKSTLLQELAERGHAVVDEPGRRIVTDQMRNGGSALPWVDLEAFARRAITLAERDRELAKSNNGPWTFFDRGLVDAYAALAHATGDTAATRHLAWQHRYNSTVFMTPPWPEIYHPDAERQHLFPAAEEEYERLLPLYPQLGYRTVILPKVPPQARADFLLQQLPER
ncbi:MAG: AAA family ATPase [Rhizobium sp.]